MLRLRIAIALVLLAAASAQAQLFPDNEARKAIVELRASEDLSRSGTDSPAWKIASTLPDTSP